MTLSWHIEMEHKSMADTLADELKEIMDQEDPIEQQKSRTQLKEILLD